MAVGAPTAELEGFYAMATIIEDDALLNAKRIAHAPFGWEVEVDLSASIDAARREALVRIYQRDGLILFRGQSLSMDEQLDACEIFGPVLRGALDNYLVSNSVEGGLLGNAELLFHSDIPFVPEPYLGGSLQALDVADNAAPTRFANSFLAYERLPVALKQRIAGLNALQVRGHMLGRRTMIADLEPGDACAVHPVVRQQFGSGRPFLFVNADMSAQITTLSPPDSDALLEELFGYLYGPTQVYEHHWRKGDLIVWDNLAVQHARSAFGSEERTLQRVSIARLGYWEQVPADLATFEALQEM